MRGLQSALMENKVRVAHKSNCLEYVAEVAAVKKTIPAGTQLNVWHSRSSTNCAYNVPLTCDTWPAAFLEAFNARTTDTCENAMTARATNSKTSTPIGIAMPLIKGKHRLCGGKVFARKIQTVTDAATNMNKFLEMNLLELT